MADDSLEQAIELVLTGKIEVARERLEIIIKNDRTNVAAWHWYAQTWPENADKVRIWQACLRLNPASQQAQQALRDLSVAPEKPVKLAAKAPAISKRRSSLSAWAVWGLMGLLAIVAVFSWVLVKNSTPKDPEQYKHVQPVEYYLYVPKDYSPEQEWPLFVGIHGAGGNGLQCWNVWQVYAEKEGFILLCPSIPGNPDGFYQNVGETTVWSAIGEVNKEYRVRQRMFMSGFSAGAFFIQGFTYHYPGYVSGLSILSSGLYLEPGMFTELVPMLVVIGGSDSPGAVQSSQMFVDGLKGYGFDIQYEVMPGVGHTVTKEGVNLTIDLFRKTIGK